MEGNSWSRNGKYDPRKMRRQLIRREKNSKKGIRHAKNSRES